jgi:hypothetical protein
VSECECVWVLVLVSDGWVSGWVSGLVGVGDGECWSVMMMKALLLIISPFHEYSRAHL